MGLLDNKDDLKTLVEKLNFKEKVERSKQLIAEAYNRYGDSLAVANSLGKDSVAVWDLAKRVNPKIRGFIVTTIFKPAETVRFMNEVFSGRMPSQGSGWRCWLNKWGAKNSCAGFRFDPLRKIPGP